MGGGARALLPRWKLAMEAQRATAAWGTSKERSHGDLKEVVGLLICQAGILVCSGIQQHSVWKSVEAGRRRGNRRDTGTCCGPGRQRSAAPVERRGALGWGPSFSHMSPTIECLPVARRLGEMEGDAEAKEAPLSTFCFNCIYAWSAPRSRTSSQESHTG
jgi:hypothetical protein